MRISSKRPLDQDLLTSSLASINLTTTDLSKLCQRVGVHGRGSRSCGRSAEFAGVMAEAAWVGVIHCQHVMKYDRWNCSLGHSRLKIMKKAFRETALMQGISAAAMTHVVSRACSAGRFSRCSCDDYSADRTENLKVWRWGGCGDNLRYGSRFAHRFFIGGKNKRQPKSRMGGKSRPPTLPAKSASKEQQSRDFKSHIEAHNAKVGIEVVVSGKSRSCKCHGVSGSCTMLTCWYQLPSFTLTAEVIRGLYESAYLVPATNVAQLLPKLKKRKNDLNRHRREITKNLRRPHSLRREKTAVDARDNREEIPTFPPGVPEAWREKPELVDVDQHQINLKEYEETEFLAKSWKKNRKNLSKGWDQNRLVYVDRSPDFCRKSEYSPGTEGRNCERGENCETLCCGRGYDTTVSEVHEPCKCSVVWCCKVHCQNCTKIAEVYTCKKARVERVLMMWG
ncbi:protein Wnt-9b-like [Macrobrachium nipponense]|uniref:protein Wnt-9b-like n=1 Tax=Macrobrachium nipponense TaxID=159736 RepID=UPI0030C8B0DA